MQNLDLASFLASFWFRSAQILLPSLPDLAVSGPIRQFSIVQRAQNVGVDLCLQLTRETFKQALGSRGDNPACCMSRCLGTRFGCLIASSRAKINWRSDELKPKIGAFGNEKKGVPKAARK